MGKGLIYKDLMKSTQNISHAIVSNVNRVLLGKPEAIRLSVVCFLAQGHLLIDDIPGVGKTTLALAMAKSLGLSFQRIQFTSDLLPSDVLGISIYNQATQVFDFKPGPIFHHVVLADEINRASPKTQSALLESMQEGQVSMDGVTHMLPDPFFVIATENPQEHYGTFPLPESQLDRFMMRLNLGYPDEESELQILKGESRQQKLNHLEVVADSKSVRDEMKIIEEIKVDESLDRYIIALAKATREAASIELGLSPRGTIALRKASQAYARVDGRDYVIPDDIKKTATAVIAHRIRLKTGHFNGNSVSVSNALVQDILGQVPVPQ